MRADAGALRTGFSLAARRSRKSTGFCIFRRSSLYKQIHTVFPDCANCSANGHISIPHYKNLYLFAQQKSRSNQRLFLYQGNIAHFWCDLYFAKRLRDLSASCGRGTPTAYAPPPHTRHKKRGYPVHGTAAYTCGL